MGYTLSPAPLPQAGEGRFRRVDEADAAVKKGSSYRKFLTGIGMTVEPPAGGSPEALAALVAAEHEELSKLVKLIGIKPE